MSASDITVISGNHYLFDLSLLPKQRLVIGMLAMFFMKSVASQPLNFPPERFQCGPDSLNLSCERWGYEACITDGGDNYCYPCSNEYLTSLCGTQEEIPGCNLYCTQKTVDTEIQRTKANFTEQLEHLFQQANLTNTENKLLVKRKKALKQTLQNKDTSLIAVSVALGIVVAFLIIICYCFIRMKRNNQKNIYDEESLNQDDRLSSTSLIKESDPDTATTKSDETEPKECIIKPDSMESVTVSSSCEEDTTSIENEASQCQENECGATLKLKSIPATNTEGKNKFAINKDDANHPSVST